MPTPLPRTPYCDDASVIADAVLARYPTAYSITFDTYDDDDTMDCGPVVDEDGRTIVADVTDLPCGALVERIVSDWSYAAFLAAGNPCFTACPTTGRPQILLQALAAADAAFGTS